MKKILSVILTLMLLFCLCACDSPVLPPERIGAGESHVHWIYYGFSDMCKNSDVIAYVEIGNWLGESEYDTFFEAKILKQYKGEALSTFTISQYGSSKITENGSPIFSHGNKIFVFLRKESSENFGEIFSIPSTYSLFYGEEYKGETYLISRSSFFIDTIDVNPSPEHRREVIKKICDNDPYYQEDFFLSGYVYAEKDIEALIKSILEKSE